MVEPPPFFFFCEMFVLQFFVPLDLFSRFIDVFEKTRPCSCVPWGHFLLWHIIGLIQSAAPFGPKFCTGISVPFYFGMWWSYLDVLELWFVSFGSFICAYPWLHIERHSFRTRTFQNVCLCILTLVGV